MEKPIDCKLTIDTEIVLFAFSLHFSRTSIGSYLSTGHASMRAIVYGLLTPAFWNIPVIIFPLIKINLLRIKQTIYNISLSLGR